MAVTWMTMNSSFNLKANGISEFPARRDSADFFERC